MTASDKRSRKEMTCKHATDRPTNRPTVKPTNRPTVRTYYVALYVTYVSFTKFFIAVCFCWSSFFAYDCFFFCFCCYNFLWELNVSANLIQIINCLFICFVYIVYFCIMSRWMFAWHILFQGGGWRFFCVFFFLSVQNLLRGLQISSYLYTLCFNMYAFSFLCYK